MKIKTNLSSSFDHLIPLFVIVRKILLPRKEKLPDRISDIKAGMTQLSALK